MAAYFIKLRCPEPGSRGISYQMNIIVDYEKFEKVDGSSIHRKIKECVGDKYTIVDITKL